MLCFDVVIRYVCTLGLLLVLHSALARRQEWQIGCLQLLPARGVP
jgi:hypothetical protein